MSDTDLSSSTAYVRNITPQQGDMFVGTLLNGRMVMFVVNESKRLGHNLIPIYEITFSLDVYLDFGFENERYRDLLSKVIQTFTYDNSYFYGNETILLEDKYQLRKTFLNDLYSMSIKWLRVAKNSNKFLTVPNTSTIDQYLNYFYLALVDTYGHTRSK